MPLPQVKVKVAVVVDPTTPANDATKLPYSSRTPTQQATALQNLNAPFAVSPWTSGNGTTGLIETWGTTLTATLDTAFQETVLPQAPTVEFVRNLFNNANPSFAQYTLQVGNLTVSSPCQKVPDCTHDCSHSFYVGRTDTTGSTMPWKVTWDGVEATVTVLATWNAP